jgi:hypothetical protein
VKIAILHAINAQKCHTELQRARGNYTEEFQGGYRQENVIWKPSSADFTIFRLYHICFEHSNSSSFVYFVIP